MIRVGRLILDTCGATFGTRRLFRLIGIFRGRAPHDSPRAFFLYVAKAVQLTSEQQQAAAINPDIARAIAYADPTGETAVNNVMRGRAR